MTEAVHAGKVSEVSGAKASAARAKARRGRGLRVRKVPERTCVACRQPQPKRNLIRLVRTSDGAVEIDATGKKSGRGAYLCRYRQCWDTGLGRRALDHALKIQLTQENRDALAKFAAQLPLTPPSGG
jgi:predicted RNA-binding protein YlxR (DUF448 family)